MRNKKSFRRLAKIANKVADRVGYALALPPTLIAALKKGRARIAAGRLAEAEATLKKVLPSDRTGETSTLLAEISLLQGDRAGALARVCALKAPPVTAACRVVLSRVFFENALFCRAAEALEPGRSTPEVERLRAIEGSLLAPLCRELYAYARRAGADHELVAFLEGRFAEEAGGALDPEAVAQWSARLAAAGDLAGALLCDRLLLCRQTALGNVEAARAPVVAKLEALGKIRPLPQVPVRTGRARIVVVMATSDPNDPYAQTNKITGSLRYFDFAETFFFYLRDEIRSSSQAAANRRLVQYCRARQPELLVTNTHFELLPETLAEIRNMGIAVVLDCHDVWMDRINFVERNLANITIGVVNGLYDFYQSLLSQPEKIYGSPGISFHPALLAPVEKDIAVSFIGTAHPVYSPVRRETLDYLKSRGIEVVELGGYAGGKLLSDEEYCTCIARSRIVLNFSESAAYHTTFDYPFLKGRALETFTAGSLLLESYNKDTARWFTPGAHYDTFADKEELERKLHLYLGDEQLRQSVAAAGHRHFMEHHHPVHLWSAIIETALAAR